MNLEQRGGAQVQLSHRSTDIRGWLCCIWSYRSHLLCKQFQTKKDVRPPYRLPGYVTLGTRLCTDSWSRCASIGRARLPGVNPPIVSFPSAGQRCGDVDEHHSRRDEYHFNKDEYDPEEDKHYSMDDKRASAAMSTFSVSFSRFVHRGSSHLFCRASRNILVLLSVRHRHRQ